MQSELIKFDYDNYEIRLYPFWTFLIHKKCKNQSKIKDSFRYRKLTSECGFCPDKIPKELLFLLEIITVYK